MKKILYFVSSLLLICGSCNQPNELTINEVISQVNSWKLSEDEIKYFDSIGESQSYVVGGVERDLDTTVNHVHIQFYREVPGTMY